MALLSTVRLVFLFAAAVASAQGQTSIPVYFSGTTPANCVLTYSSGGAPPAPILFTCVAGSGTGTVTNVSSGDLSPLFTVVVSNPTTTPSLAYTLSNAAAYSYLGNNTSAAAAPAYVATLNFKAGTNFNLLDPTDTTKIAQFDVSNIATLTTRVITVPNAASVTVVPDAGAANNFLTAISTLGAISKARPTWANVDKTTSSIADITTRACANLSDGATGCSTTVGTAATHPATDFATAGAAVAGGTCTNGVAAAISTNGVPTCTTGDTTTTHAFFATAGTPAFRAIVAGDLPTAIRTVSIQPGLGDGFNAIPAQTYTYDGYYNDTGATITITGIKCKTDNSGTSTLDVKNGAGTSLLTGVITCTNAYAAGTQSATTTIASADRISIIFVADGTSKYVQPVITATR